MFVALVIAALLLVSLALLGLAREVRSDGYGHRHAPESFHAWGATGLPSASYRRSADR